MILPFVNGPVNEPYEINPVSITKNSQDTLRPSIEEWNFTYSIFDGEDFDVWALVTDNDSGVHNVSLIVRDSHSSETKHLMSFNGTYYTALISGLALNETYELEIEAFDIAGNHATSYKRTVDLTIRTITEVDPWFTMPYVVTSSIGLLCIVLVLAFIVDRRKSSISPGKENESTEIEELETEEEIM